MNSVDCADFDPSEYELDRLKKKMEKAEVIHAITKRLGFGFLTQEYRNKASNDYVALNLWRKGRVEYPRWDSSRIAPLP